PDGRQLGKQPGLTTTERTRMPKLFVAVDLPTTATAELARMRLSRMAGLRLGELKECKDTYYAAEDIGAEWLKTWLWLKLCTSTSSAPEIHRVHWWRPAGFPQAGWTSIGGCSSSPRLSGCLSGCGRGA